MPAAGVRGGGRPIAPDPGLSHAADYLRMLEGAAPDAARVAGLEAYLVTVADHGMNASTFAARVVTSTGSDAVSAIVAAIGALKGPLHGGAPGPVLDMLDAIGEPGRAAAWIDAELAAGRRIMGMGHRIYRVRDPRAAGLERAVARLGQAGAATGGPALPRPGRHATSRGRAPRAAVPERAIAAPDQAGASTGRLALARAVERAAEGALRAKYPGRPLAANVEFYTAVLLDTVGIDRAAFAPTFAVGRVAGWAAHVLEQRETGRLIRPASRYVGPAPA